MKNIEKVAEELFNKIRSRFERVQIGDQNAKSTTNPNDARFFNFDYVNRRGKNFGNITVSLIDENSLKILYSSQLISEVEQDPQDQKEWYAFLRGMRFFAKRNLLAFDARDITRSNLTVRDLKTASAATGKYDISDNPVTESKLYGTTRTSIQEFGSARLLIKHSQAVNEEIPGSRSRKIHSLFIETDGGERFLLPFKKLSAGRAMAEHIAHGGYIHDSVGKYLTKVVEEMNNLVFFIRGTRNRVFEDSETQAMVEAANSRYSDLRLELKGLGTKRGYQKFAENFQIDEQTTHKIDLAELKERFVKKMFDDRLSNALPYVYRAYQESLNKNSYIKEFEQWTNENAEVSDSDIKDLNDIMQNSITVGLDGIDAIAAIKDIIQDEELFNEIENLSKTVGVEADARPLIADWASQNGYQLDFSPENDVDNFMPRDSSSATVQQPPADQDIAQQDIKEMIKLAGL